MGLLGGCVHRGSSLDGRIVFSSNRSVAPGTHLWAIDPSGDLTSLKQLTFGDQADHDPRVSPDGTLMAFARTRPSGAASSSIWVRSLVSGVETRITNDESASDTLPFWSPNGNVLGFVRGAAVPGNGSTTEQRVWVVPIVHRDARIQAGRPSMPADIPAISADWNPVTGSDLLLMRQEPDGWAPFSIIRLPYPPASPTVLIAYDGRGYYTPTYSPDGLRFAFVRYRREIDLGELYVARADGSEPTPIACQPGWNQPAWSPNGTEVVVVRSTEPGLWRLTVPPAGAACSEGVRVTRGAYQDTSPDWAVVRR